MNSAKNKSKLYAAILILLVLCIITACGQPKDPSTDSPANPPQEENTEPELPDEPEIPEEPPAPPEPEVTTIVISAAGDCTLGRNQKMSYKKSWGEYFDKYGASYFFDSVRDIFSSDDLTIVNLEGSLTNSKNIQTTYYNPSYGKVLNKEWNHKGKPEYVAALIDGSIEAVSYGNNHNRDYGQEGYDETVKTLEDANIAWACDDSLGYYTVKGIKIGFVSVNMVYDGYKLSCEKLQPGIEKLREECDFVIACIHMGGDHKPDVFTSMKKLSHHCIDWGADIVIGNHAHMISAAEVYKDKYIFYALGNFSYGGNNNPKDKDCLILRGEFTFTDKVLSAQEIQVIPCSVSSSSKVNTFQPTPATGSEYTRIMKKLNGYCKPFNLKFDDEGYPQAL